MIESFNHACNRNAANTLLGHISKEVLKLNQFDWKRLTGVLTFLKKFKDAVDILSAQKKNVSKRCARILIRNKRFTTNLNR